MTIYIDENFRCHTTSAGGLKPVETLVFEGKCSRYIQGYRFVPNGENWTREDGVVFAGEMISPAENIELLEAAQAAYEQALEDAERFLDMQAALEVLGVQP